MKTKLRFLIPNNPPQLCWRDSRSLTIPGFWEEGTVSLHVVGTAVASEGWPILVQRMDGLLIMCQARKLHTGAFPA